MDFIGLVNALVTWFTANWSTIESLARNLAADIAAVWALALALSQVLKKFFPNLGWGQSLENKTIGVFKK